MTPTQQRILVFGVAVVIFINVVLTRENWAMQREIHHLLSVNSRMHCSSGTPIVVDVFDDIDAGSR